MSWTRKGPDWSTAPWEIVHGGAEHHAWYQRAFVTGDFTFDAEVIGHYVVREDGRSANPFETPRCETCGEIPLVKDLMAYSRHKETLERERKYWPHPPTDHETCWWCNDSKDLAHEAPPLCSRCLAHLANVPDPPRMP